MCMSKYMYTHTCTHTSHSKGQLTLQLTPELTTFAIQRFLNADFLNMKF